MKMKRTIILGLTTSVCEHALLSGCVCVCTIVLILDGKAEDVAGPEARAIVHTAVEERVRVGILDVKDLTRGGHVACDALVSRDPELLLQPRRRNSIVASVEHQKNSRSEVGEVQTLHLGVSPPRHSRHHHQRLWPPARG